MLSEERRREIATFLRLRRERLQPEQVNLPRGHRRRTPGLRREEVAALAGVSTEWYTWLEQARDVQPSVDTLRRIAAALRLEAGEAQHLLTLARHRVSRRLRARRRPHPTSDGRPAGRHGKADRPVGRRTRGRGKLGVGFVQALRRT